jgi:hypothetical protein
MGKLSMQREGGRNFGRTFFHFPVFERGSTVSFSDKDNEDKLETKK